jgi:hypothetical protein
VAKAFAYLAVGLRFPLILGWAVVVVAAAPVYLLAASVLAVLATLGLTVVICDAILGSRDLVYFVPFAAGVLLVSLGSDYNVFVVGRIWEEARELPTQDAARVLLQSSLARFADVLDPVTAPREIMITIADATAIEEGVTAYRALTADRPDVFARRHANSLETRDAILSALSEEADGDVAPE